jgi:hypothetical protein
MLVPVEQGEEFHDMGVPPGHVARQLFQHGRRALPPPVIDGLGDVGAQANRARRLEVRAREVGEARLGRGCGGREVEIVQRDIANQVADIRNDPALAGLDEGVVPQLLGVVAQGVGFLGNQP